MPYEEKRLGERITCQEPVRVENCESGEVVAGNLYNYSITGFYFETDLPMVIGTEVRLFSDRDNLQPDLNHIRGKVRWYQEITGAVVLHTYGYGVEFDRPLLDDMAGQRFRVIEGGISQTRKPVSQKSNTRR
jgi:hypothetical protein